MKITFATKLTVARIVFIPLFVVLFYLPELKIGNINIWYLLALLLFIVLSITDWLDGYIARNYNQTSDLGKFLDPLADKVLVSSAMVMLLTVNMFPAWAIIAMLTREFVVAGIRMIAATEKIVIAADMAGKIKTVLQMVALILALLMIAFDITQFSVFMIYQMLIIILTVATLYSGYNYTVSYLRHKMKG